MSGSQLDQIVKGAPPPGTSTQNVVSRSPSPAPVADNRNSKPAATSHVSDPLSTLPSSPPQIYLNLLIMEASLRSQYLGLRARRRQHIFFLLLLGIWIASFFYALFLRPREDGSGMGGSVYWVVEMAEKVALMGGVVTGILIWGTGQWERGVRWPRRWLGVANRGLRTMNTKIIIIRGPWWRELFGHMVFLFPYSSFFPSQGSSYHYIEAAIEKRILNGVRHGHDEDIDVIREEDLAPGGDHIKLLLLPKPFSPDFRENWELYRTEYWEKENERRAILLQRVKKHERQKAKQDGGWLWWMGWRGWARAKAAGERAIDIEKSHFKDYTDVRPRLAGMRTESHSRNTSRSSTTSTPDAEERPSSGRLRRGSSSNGSLSDRRKKGKPTSSGHQVSRLTPAELRSGTFTSTASSPPLRRGASSISLSSGNDSDR
ncbi:hypothetical protein MMC06_000901 [Schaereria dolodes]|nr:hypothetical protein [Schaereria dolodes]